MKKISLSFFILLILLVQVFLTDSMIYFWGINYGLANVIASVLNVSFVIYLIKKKYIEIENCFNKWDIVFFIILLLVIIATIYFPDVSWDSFSYHIYMQEKPFNDKIYSDFFPGRTLTSFIYPLADRLNYMFRLLLGFRIGTIGGYFLLIIIYYECKKILKLILDRDIEEKYLSILSIFPLTAYVILQQLGTYYIDNFSVVILLEFVYIVIKETNSMFKDKIKLYYLALITGIAVCIKITNIIYIILPLIYILIKNIKNIKNLKWYDYLFLITTFVLPFLPYLLNTYIKTGNPVFPYYNKIFNSKYFAKENWLDTRYGPKNFLQFIIWPIYIIKYPNKAYEIGKVDLSFAIGYVIIISYLASLIYKKITKKEIIINNILKYNIILFCFYLVWAKFILGYTRYAGIISVLSTILLIKYLIDFVKDMKKLLTIISTIILTISSMLGIYQFYCFGACYYYPYLIKGNLIAKAKIEDNISKIFKDKNSIKYDIDGIWGVVNDDCAVPLFLNVDDKIVHLEYGFKTGDTEETNNLYWDNVLNNDIYVPLYEFKLSGKIEYLEEYHFEITEMKDILTNVSFLEANDKIYIVKVKYNQNLKKDYNVDKFKELYKNFRRENE